MRKNPKNLLGVFFQVKIGLKKKLSPKEFVFIKGTFWKNTPNIKKWVQSLKHRIFCFFLQNFTKGIQVKFNELESESGIFA